MAGRFCASKTGCCTPKVWAIIFAVLSLGFMFVAILVPPLVQGMIDDGLCDQICIPDLDSAEWEYNNWVSTDNATYWPPEYYRFWLYNITNPSEVEQGGVPVLYLMGPYTYNVSRYKFNVEYDDSTYVRYETQEVYKFVPEMSNGSESDWVTSINLPFLGAVQQLFVFAASYPPYDYFCKDSQHYTTGNDNQSCLWSNRTVHSTLWTQFSYVTWYSNFLYSGGQDYWNDDFQLFANFSTPEEAHNYKMNMSNYGLGGKCVPYDTGIGMGCLDPLRANITDIRHVQNTGRSNIDDIYRFVKYYGNDSIYGWNPNISNGIEEVDGTDHYQFKPWLDKGDVLKTFDPILSRQIKLEYYSEESYLDVTYWRYVPTSDFFDVDEFYNGNYRGFVNASLPSLLVHGVSAPVGVSRLYQAGANDSVRATWNCLNCPYVDPSADLTQYGPYVFVQPTLGKTLGGSQQVQFNAHLQPWQFKSGHIPSTYYYNMSEIWMPVFIMTDTSMFGQDQADQVNDGLDDIDLGQMIQKVALIVGAVLASIFGVLAIVLACRWRQIQRESEENWADTTDYQGLPSRDSEGTGRNVNY